MDGWMTDRQRGRQANIQTDIHTNTKSMPEYTLHGQTVTVTCSDLLIWFEPLDYPLHIQTRSFSHQGLKQDKSMNINIHQSILIFAFICFPQCLKVLRYQKTNFPPFPPKHSKKILGSRNCLQSYPTKAGIL